MYTFVANKKPRNMKIRKINYEAPLCEEFLLSPSGVLAASFVGERLVEDDSDADGVWTTNYLNQ